MFSPMLILNPGVVKTVKGTVTINFVDIHAIHPTGVDIGLLTGVQTVNLGAATHTVYGWLRVWTTTSVSNGTYQIQPVLHHKRGNTMGAPVTVIVKNP